MAILSQLPKLLRYTIFNKLSKENLMMLQRVSKGDHQQIRDYKSFVWQHIEDEQLKQLENSYTFLTAENGSEDFQIDEIQESFYVPTFDELPKTIDTLKKWEIAYFSFAEKVVGGDFAITIEQSQNFSYYLPKICSEVGHKFIESPWQRTAKFARAFNFTSQSSKGRYTFNASPYCFLLQQLKKDRWACVEPRDSYTNAFNAALNCFSEQELKKIASHNGQPTIAVFKILYNPNGDRSMHLLEMRVFGKKANIAQKYVDVVRVNPYVPDKILSLLPSCFDSIWQEAANIHHSDLSAVMGYFFRQLHESATKEKAWSDILEQLAKKIKGESILELTDNLVSVVTTLSPKENEKILPQYLNLLHYLTVKFSEIQAERRKHFRNENNYQKELEEKKLEEISKNKPLDIIPEIKIENNVPKKPVTLYPNYIHTGYTLAYAQQRKNNHYSIDELQDWSKHFNNAPILIRDDNHQLSLFECSNTTRKITPNLDYTPFEHVDFSVESDRYGKLPASAITYEMHQAIEKARSISEEEVEDKKCTMF